MLFLLLIFRVGILVSGDRLQRPFGMVLLAAYVLFVGSRLSVKMA